MTHGIEARGAAGGSGGPPRAGAVGARPGVPGGAEARARRGVPRPPGGEGPTAADSLFLCKATLLNMATLEASHSAKVHGADAALREVAAQMADILGRIDGECRQLAARYGIPVAEGLDHEHRRQLAALQRLSGAAFADSYLRRFAMGAQLELIRLCGTELTDGSAEALRAAAGKWLQALRNALAVARRVYFTPVGS